MPTPLLRPARLRFRPRWWAVALAAAGCVAGVLLGQWQAGRAQDKRAMAAAAPMTLRGQLLPEHTLFLQNRLRQGRPGFYVVQPLRQRDGRIVLVLRGWSPLAASPPTPRGEVILEGVQRDRLPRAFEAGEGRAAGNVRQNVTIGEFSAWSGLRLEPYIVEQHSGLVVTQPPAPADGLVRDWPQPAVGAQKHESYSFQWYALAVLSIVLLIALNLKIERPQT